MSTTFGVKTSTGKIIEVAFRASGMRWKSPLAELLPNDTPVIPLDNSAQGIHTIGDIKQDIAEQQEYTL